LDNSLSHKMISIYRNSQDYFSGDAVIDPKRSETKDRFRAVQVLVPNSCAEGVAMLFRPEPAGLCPLSRPIVPLA
jgi:hypothetical protein